TKSGDEDRIAFFFDMGQTGTNGASCSATCHGDGKMRTDYGKLDLWHWKAVRSNPMGLVDDNYVDSLNRQGDPGTSAAADNPLVFGHPTYMSINDPHANVDFLLKDDAALNAFDPYGVMTTYTKTKSTAFDSLAAFSSGDFIPGYLLRVSTGDRASVLAAGKWNNGVWTVEFKKPYAGTDNDFAVVPGSSVAFTYEIFDNEGANHWMNGFDVTLLTLDFSGLTDVTNELGNLPAAYNLEQNYPNPFNPSTKINFSVPAAEFVSIDVFNSIGQKVTTLINEQMSAGNYSVDFNAVNIPSGIYFYKMTSSDFSSTRKMILIK
ncbi:MAG: ethylbenzene dehydrogenase-related protein, partial [Ignavibacteria bacterium]|nr:ethylbenzene dehydrogenase-related protein [Ignavibacteria bacterium]